MNIRLGEEKDIKPGRITYPFASILGLLFVIYGLKKNQSYSTNGE